MATWGRIEHLPENQTFLESLSPWKDMRRLNNNYNIHVRCSSPESSPFWSRLGKDENRGPNNKNPRSSTCSFSSMSSESLSLCTEGLGFESFDDVEDSVRSDHHVFNNNNNNERQFEEERGNNPTVNVGQDHSRDRRRSDSSKRSRIRRGDFPPPISCIGRSGKPWVCFKSYREDGRFILKEVRVPTQEFLHACREDGRLRLKFVHSDDDEVFEEDDGEKKETLEV